MSFLIRQLHHRQIWEKYSHKLSTFYDFIFINIEVKKRKQAGNSSNFSDKLLAITC